jgi:hypothetical protein
MPYRVPRPLSTSALTSAVLALCFPRSSAKADGSLAYKYEDYSEEGGRIQVITNSSSADQDIGPYAHIRLTGTIDSVSGATPTGVPAPVGSDQVEMTDIHTRRKAWSGDLSYQFNNINVDGGFADSREPDYVSRGWSLSTLTDFNQKNTTVRFGVAGTDDNVEVFFQPEYLPKRTNDAILGVTQLIDPLTVVTFNVTFGRATGYLSEPHKFVSKSIQVVQGVFLLEDFGENSPNERNTGTAFASINRAFPSLHGAIEGSYRFYSDTFGVVAHTLEADWYQHLGSSFTLGPSVRFYQQTAANFYYYNLDDTSIIPVRVPTGAGPNYTSDFRLSAMRNLEYGMQAIWNVAAQVQFQLEYKRYTMWGTDGVTPKSAYPTANITTVGIKYLW